MFRGPVFVEIWLLVKISWCYLVLIGATVSSRYHEDIWFDQTSPIYQGACFDTKITLHLYGSCSWQISLV